MNKKNILIGATGSISILELPFWIETIRKSIHSNIKIILTDNARRFVREEVLSAIICDTVHVSNFEINDFSAHHSVLAQWADILIVLPATANIIGKVANGIADDLLTSTAIAINKPILFAPAMNKDMWGNKAVQRNIKILRNDNHTVIEPDEAMAYQISKSKEAEGFKININKVIIHLNRAFMSK